MRIRIRGARIFTLWVASAAVTHCGGNTPTAGGGATTGAASSAGASGTAAGGGTGTSGVAASGTSGSGVGASGTSGSASGVATSGASTGTASGAGSSGSGSSGVTLGAGDAGACLGASQLAALGKTRLLIGVSTEDAPTLAAAPFDVRYRYIAGGVFDGPAPCTACDSTCTSGGTSCASGCGWWGCYNTPPGMYAGYFETTCAAATPAQIPMYTYYELLQTAFNTFSGFQEGTAEATQAAANIPFMTRYLGDWRFLLKQIGDTIAIVQIEPDFWGYAQLAGSDPTALPAAVANANQTDCASMPNTIAGMGKCMVAMARKYAPRALVGLSSSEWATGVDVGLNTDKTLDVAGEAKKVAKFLGAAGGAEADIVIVETSDRDAGYYQSMARATFWDTTNATLPSFHQDFAWVKALAEGLGKPALYWQTPLGNANQNNTPNHWKDNRVDYFFAHTSELAAAHVIGVAFGAGAGDQTLPETDGNNLVAKAKAYASGAGQALCP